jgi:putative Mn2+ efflux pump MntP
MKNKSYLVGGIILIIIGIIWMLNALNIHLPKIILSFPSLVTMIGLLILVQAKFKSELGWIVFGFGNVLLMNKLFPNQNITQIGVAGILIILGIYYLLRYFRSEDSSKTINSNQ